MVAASPIALITGASGGIGRACAQALAEQGCAVALQFNQGASRAEETALAIRANGGSAELFQSDLSIPESAALLVDEVAERLGGPTILLHAAGILSEQPLLFTKPEAFQFQLQLHALAALELSQRMARYLRKSSSGRLVFIGSLAGAIGLGNGAAYAAAKGALHGLARSLALEIARWGATANVIAPGYIETEMLTGQDEKRRAAQLEAIPLKRYGRAEEVAALAAYLCSPAGAYLTGQVLLMDGGLSLE
jgi:3-oxoacyl-[acyl-carrier protein] reductase